MDTILLILGGLLISYIAIRLWIWIVDTFFKGLKHLNPFRKKNTQTWHSLNSDAIQDQKNKNVRKEEYIDDIMKGD